MSWPPTSTRVAPHTGRGGWTWYTGSAGWMYRLIVESLLGLRLEVDKLHFAPCLPADWDVVQDPLPLSRNGLSHHHRANPRRRPAGVTVDGVEQDDQAIPLVDDQREHKVEVRVSAL